MSWLSILVFSAQAGRAVIFVPFVERIFKSAAPYNRVRGPNAAGRDLTARVFFVQ